MVRHRKVTHAHHGNSHKHSDGSGGSSGAVAGAGRAFKMLSIWKTGVGCFCLVVAVYVGILGYLETRVNTPFDDEKVSRLTELTTLNLESRISTGNVF